MRVRLRILPIRADARGWRRHYRTQPQRGRRGTEFRHRQSTHAGAVASLREGLDETLTVLRLNVPPTLARTLRSTNCIESMISVCREHASNVKRWRDGQMALRWCAAGMVEACKQFRRVNGHLHLPALRAALEREVAASAGTMGHDDQVSAALCSPDRAEVPRNSGHLKTTASTSYA